MIDPQAIRIDPERCLNRWSTFSHCELCSRCCALEALSLEGGTPRLRTDACEGCGVCLGVCPSGAFSCNGWSERKFLDGIRRIRQTDSIPLIACSARGTHAGSLPYLFRTTVCLGTFSVGALFEAAFDGDVILAIDNCKACLHQGGYVELSRRIRLANELLAAVHANGRVKTSDTENVEALHETAVSSGIFLDERKSQTGELPDLYARRRQALISRFFRSEDARAKKEAAHRAGGAPRQEAMLSIPDLTPAWKRDLLTFWKSRVASTEKDIGAEPPTPWPLVSIDTARCVACSTCCQYCPSHALTRTFENGWFSISFEPGRCMDCGQCEQSCQTQALSRARGKTTKPFEPAPIVRYAAHECPLCRGAARGREASLCYWCQSQSGANQKRMIEDMRRYVQ